ncbi:F-box protein PP2-A12-like [Diospyros lotus]|uniref:F-box protein PP2-A12-like n=1 Tax=Diospyros lotus TaxID=55363 RepID=UPI002254C7F3|nr:F-box protein PP2-A12-like [Diospyros lotus]
MGSGLSSLFTARNPPSPEPSLGDLPESCVASVVAYLDPPEICRLALLNRAFSGASSADFVWESKLPQNYHSVIQKVFDRFPSNLCKKEIYARLCRQNSFDGGTKKVWLDKRTGRVCLSISSCGLAITGVDDRRYWNRIQTDESRFGAVAYLQQIWWFEVDGELEFPFPAGSYSLFFRLHLGRTYKSFGRRVCNSEHVHGWDKKPARFHLTTSDGQEAISQCFLGETGKWIYCHVGDFLVDNPSAPTKIKFSMTQIDCTHTKGGLCVDSVVIYPSEFRERLKRF